MKILQICHKVPFPPKDGGCIAMNNITQGLLAQGHKVKILAINTPKHFVDVKELPSEYRSSTDIETVFIDTSVKAIPAFLNLFSGSSYNIDRFYSEEFEKKIIEELKKENYDIVQLESLFVSMYIPAIKENSKAKVVLRSHNIEYKIWERNATSSTVFLKKIYFNFLAARLKKYELSQLAFYDAVAAISERDAEWFKENFFEKPLLVAPFGIDVQMARSLVESDKRSLFHIGAMDWHPNIEGVNWFLDNVWDKVIASFPDVKLYLAGRKINSDIKTEGRKNIVVAGEVDDAHKFMSSKGLMVIPLLSGGGMRIKLIEGMSLSKVIVSTTVGAEGVNCTNGKNILIADTPEEFVKAISQYLNDAGYLSSIGKNASELVAVNYGNKVISEKLSSFYKELIA
jgi:glycosyltransferase involved in cell wall biosynthesis